MTKKKNKVDLTEKMGAFYFYSFYFLEDGIIDATQYWFYTDFNWGRTALIQKTKTLPNSLNFRTLSWVRLREMEEHPTL